MPPAAAVAMRLRLPAHDPLWPGSTGGYTTAPPIRTGRTAPTFAKNMPRRGDAVRTPLEGAPMNDTKSGQGQLFAAQDTAPEATDTMAAKPLPPRVHFLHGTHMRSSQPDP